MDTIEDTGIENPLLTGLTPPSNQSSERITARKRMQRRIRTTHTSDFTVGQINIFGRSSLDEQGLYKFHPTLKQVSLFLSIYLGVGTFCFFSARYQFEGHKTNGILDAVYFCVVTMTTVGYGDLVPASTTSKLLACAFVFAGMAIVGLILSTAADYLVEKQELYFVKALHIRQKVGHSDIMKELESNRVFYKLLIITGVVFVLMIVGIVFLIEVEELDFVDAFYCVCSTITTLGYGDKSFSTKAGRYFAIFWILISCISVALFFLYIAEWHTERRQRSLTKWVLMRRMTLQDLEAADIDDNGVVSAAEFVIYKLKEMGKISSEDISLLLQKFENLDVDESGTLSASDLALA